MTLLEELAKQLSALPPKKQSQVLDFIASLSQQGKINWVSMRPKLWALKIPTGICWKKSRRISAGESRE